MWWFESWKRDGAGAGAVRGWGPLMSYWWFCVGIGNGVNGCEWDFGLGEVWRVRAVESLDFWTCSDIVSCAVWI